MSRSSSVSSSKVLLWEDANCFCIESQNSRFKSGHALNATEDNDDATWLINSAELVSVNKYAPAMEMAKRVEGVMEQMISTTFGPKQRPA